MGCGDTLFLGEGGYVTCSLVGCPRPTAASDILEDGETAHIVVLEDKGFTIRHPLNERLDGGLFDCHIRQELQAMGGPPAKPGFYRVERDAGGLLTFTEAKA